MSALFIGPEQKAEIATLVEKAKRNKVTYDAKLEAPDHEASMVSLYVELPVHYVVQFSIEELSRNNFYRHLSISNKKSRAGHGPSPDVVSTVMAEFGFIRPLLDCRSWIVDLENGSFVVHVMETITEECLTLQ